LVARPHLVFAGRTEVLDGGGVLVEEEGSGCEGDGLLEGGWKLEQSESGKQRGLVAKTDLQRELVKDNKLRVQKGIVVQCGFFMISKPLPQFLDHLQVLLDIRNLLLAKID
jgi:hypothetical protein